MIIILFKLVIFNQTTKKGGIIIKKKIMNFNGYIILCDKYKK